MTQHVWSCCVPTWTERLADGIVWSVSMTETMSVFLQRPFTYTRRPASATDILAASPQRQPRTQTNPMYNWLKQWSNCWQCMHDGFRQLATASVMTLQRHRDTFDDHLQSVIHTKATVTLQYMPLSIDEPQTDRAIDRQGYRQTGPQIDRATDRQGYRQTAPQTDRATDRQGYRQTGLQIDRATDRQRHRQTGLPTDRATDRQGHRQTAPQTDSATDRQGYR